MPTDWTWGCAPGYICHPKRSGADSGCNVQVGFPSDQYVCSPDECIKAPKYIHDQYWGTPGTSDEIGTVYNVSQGYFNLDPKKYGLNDTIFQVLTTPGPTQLMSARSWYARRSVWGALLGRQSPPSGTIPGNCYDDCNNAGLVAQSVGKKPELCEAGSDFIRNLGVCEKCCNAYQKKGSGTYDKDVKPEFQQWLYYCANQGTRTTSAAGQTVSSTTTSPSSTTRRPTSTKTASTTAGHSSGSSSQSSSQTSGVTTPTSRSVTSGTANTGASTSGTATSVHVISTGTSGSGSEAGGGGGEAMASSTSSVTTSRGVEGTTSTGGSSGTSEPPLFTGAATTLAVPWRWSLFVLIFEFVAF
ncbi:hypothetical protein BJX96DRAFT_115847 [Aspergillus floccosus]